jgi:hypothetical protein
MGRDLTSAAETDWPQSRLGVMRPNVAPEPATAVVCKNSRRVEVRSLMRGIIREAQDLGLRSEFNFALMGSVRQRQLND